MRNANAQSKPRQVMGHKVTLSTVMGPCVLLFEIWLGPCVPFVCIAHFHEVVDDDIAVFMTDLVKGYGDIHVFVEHPMNEPVELPVEDLKSLAVRPPGSEPEGVNALEVFGGDQQNEDVVYYVSSDNELQSDHFYEYAEYEEDNVNVDDDGEYRPNFSQFGGHDNAETNNADHGEAHDNVDEEYIPDFSQFRGHDNAENTNVDHGKPHEVDVE
ncbi:hypothetical protein SO802_023607 [Lithocarpus litseifolius]|uniref:Uncharacterized protein n=1 Tax=Lithocarpus litseifolius TaxID=425828 RepID=A0AAW2CAK1_9ROSI